jgi:hypothetical protein
MFTQLVPQNTLGDWQVLIAWQTPPWQLWLEPQTLPQLPQFALSVRTLRQVPLHSMFGAWQVLPPAQPPFTQV